MNGVPIVLRLWLMGTACGVACGILTAWVIASALAVSAGGSFDLGGVLVGVALVGYLGAFCGAFAGAAFGCPTGLLAGLFLVKLLPPLGPRAATWVTVIVVMASQVTIGVAVFGLPESSTLWVYVLVPAITVVPLTLATRAAARDASARTVGRRDTLAA